MNERILELAKQADPDHWHSRWYSGINPRVLDPEIKKFVELLIRECAKICDELQNVPATEPRHCAEDIRIHFGVKE